MDYQKPTIMNLGSRARPAKGQGPLSCISGGSASGLDETCSTGTSADWSCSGGSGVAYGYGACISGSAPADFGDCHSGTSPDLICMSGSTGDVDGYGCRSGPAPV